MRIMFLLFSLAILSTVSVAQIEPAVQWTQVFGGGIYEFGRGVQQIADGGFIVAGTTYDFYAGEYNIYLIKLGPETSISQPGPAQGFSEICVSPNPFNISATISFTIPDEADESISLSIYDTSGRIVTTIIDRTMAAGSHSLVWSGTDGEGNRVCPGVYFCRIEGSSFSGSRRMILTDF